MIELVKGSDNCIVTPNLVLCLFASIVGSWNIFIEADSFLRVWKVLAENIGSYYDLKSSQTHQMSQTTSTNFAEYVSKPL